MGKKERKIYSDDTLMEAVVELKHKKKGKIKFKVIHNLPEVPGLRIDDALQNWIPRTDTYTAKSFCEYVNSKNTGFICMTEDAYNKIKDEDH